MKNILNRVLKYTVVLSLLACLMTCSALSVMATTGIYVGDSSFQSGSSDWTMDCYVYHNANTSSYIEISSMSQIIDNNGTTKVTIASFEAQDGTSSNILDDIFADDMPDNGIAGGSIVRVEVDWENICDWNGLSNRYNKNGSPAHAFTSMFSGTSSRFNACGLDTIWYASYYESEPHS